MAGAVEHVRVNGVVLAWWESLPGRGRFDPSLEALGIEQFAALFPRPSAALSAACDDARGEGGGQATSLNATTPHLPHHTPGTLSLDPEPPEPKTQNPKPKTQNPKPKIRNPEP
jgi:hypothetical protein